ncbi:MAG: hypothetical protein R2838_01100 [Caldilineaceae bacterium]
MSRDRTATLRVVGSVVSKPRCRARLGQLRRRPLIRAAPISRGRVGVGTARDGHVGRGRRLHPVDRHGAAGGARCQAPMAPVVVVVPVNKRCPPPRRQHHPTARSAAGVALRLCGGGTPAARDGNVPLVSADQVSVPGGVAPGVGSSGVTSETTSGPVAAAAAT